MIKILVIIIGVLIFSITVLCIIVYFLREEINDKQKAMESVINANTRLHDEIKRFNSIDKIKSDNRREASEKIKNLYDGDGVDNAINILCDNKNG